MNRSGYSDDCDDNLASGRWRGMVKSAIRGKRGQSFLRELAAEMDKMPVKELIAEELVRPDGQCCTIGVVCKSRGLDVAKIDVGEPDQVSAAVGIASCLAAEIENENDDGFWHYERNTETPAERWVRMRKWVDQRIVKVT